MAAIELPSCIDQLCMVFDLNHQTRYQWEEEKFLELIVVCGRKHGIGEIAQFCSSIINEMTSLAYGYIELLICLRFPSGNRNKQRGLLSLMRLAALSSFKSVL